MKRFGLVLLAGLLMHSVAWAAPIISIDQTQLPKDNGARLVYVTVDLSGGPRPTRLNLYVDGRLKVQHAVQSGPTDWLVWQPDSSDFGLERLLRVEATGNGATVNDSRSVSIWPNTPTAVLRMGVTPSYVSVTRSLPGRAVSATIKLYIDGQLVSSVTNALGASVTLIWKPLTTDRGRQHAVRIETTVPLFGTTTELQRISL